MAGDDEETPKPPEQTLVTDTYRKTTGRSRVLKPLTLGDPRLQIASPDNSNTILVSDLLTTVNYGEWKRDLRLALVTRNKLGFIDGSIPEPTIEADYYDEWYRVDAIVRTWILNSISKELVPNFKGIETAFLLCQSLEQLYGQPNAMQIYDIHHSIFLTAQNNLPVSNYYTKLHTLWAALDSLLPELSGLAAWNILKVSQFLHGLNVSYDTVKHQILTMENLPTLERAYAIVLQFERRISGVQTATVQESALVFKDSPQNNSASYKKDHKGRFCTKCKRPGHSVEECFKGTNERPDWWFKLMRKLGRPIPPYITLAATISEVSPTNNSAPADISAANPVPSQSTNSAGFSGLESSALKLLVQEELHKMLKTSTEQAHALSLMEFTGPGF